LFGLTPQFWTLKKITGELGTIICTYNRFGSILIKLAFPALASLFGLAAIPCKGRSPIATIISIPLVNHAGRETILEFDYRCGNIILTPYFNSKLRHFLGKRLKTEIMEGC